MLDVGDVFFETIGLEVDHLQSGIGMNHGLRGDDHDVGSLKKIGGLLCGQNDVSVVWEDDDVVRVARDEGLHEVVRAWVHALTAGDDLVASEGPEELGDLGARRHGDNRVFLPLGLLHGELFVKKDLVVLEVHVLHFERQEFPEPLRVFNRQGRIFRMDVDFDDIPLAQGDDGIAKAFEGLDHLV